MSSSRHYSILGLSLREHIGGRWAIPWALYFWTLPINVFATMASNISPNASVRSFWALLAAALASYVALGSVLGLADITVLRRRSIHPVPVWVVVCLGAAAGLIRVPVLNWVLATTGASPTWGSADLQRMFTSAILGAVLIPAGALVTSSFHRYRDEKKRLIAEQVAWSQKQLRAEGESRAMREALLTDIALELESATAKSITASDVESASAALRSVGQQLWSETTSEAPLQGPAVTWRELMRSSIYANPLPTWAVVIPWALTAAANQIPRFGTAMGITVTMIMSAVIAACFALGNLILGNNRVERWVVFIGTLLCAWLTVSLGSLLILRDEPLAVTIPVIIANAVWLPVLTIMAALVVGALRSSEEILAILRTSASDAEIRALAAQGEATEIRREVAIALHGPVRSRLATAAAITEGLQTGSEANLHHELHQALAELRALEDPSDPQPLDTCIDAATLGWSALLEVNVQSPSKHHSRATDASAIVEEAIANAYRHGSASTVNVTVTVTPTNDLMIEVMDNGTGCPADPIPGLGSRSLDRWATNAWTRGPAPGGGTHLQVLLASTDPAS